MKQEQQNKIEAKAERTPVEWLQAAINALRLEVDSSIVDQVQERWNAAKEYLEQPMGILLTKGDEVNGLLVGALRFLNEEGRIALRDALIERTPKPEQDISDEDIEKLADKYAARNNEHSLSLAKIKKDFIKGYEPAQSNTQKPCWVKASERLPDDNQKVLYFPTTEGCYNYKSYHLRLGVFLKKDQWERANMFCDGSFISADKVAVWMPAPEYDETNTQPNIFDAHIGSNIEGSHLCRYSSLVCSKCRGNSGVNFRITEDEYERFEKLLITKAAQQPVSPCWVKGKMEAFIDESKNSLAYMKPGAALTASDWHKIYENALFLFNEWLYESNTQPNIWLDVRDRLPGDDGMCLCLCECVSTYDDSKQTGMSTGNYTNGHFLTQLSYAAAFYKEVKVTHWMPLPLHLTINLNRKL